MIEFAVAILHFLGASIVHIDFMEATDPTTEEEFNQLNYEPPNTITWSQYQDAKETVKNQIGMAQIRKLREPLLLSTDWIMTYDNAMSLENLEEWIQYRQALRDMTSLTYTFIFNGGSVDTSQIQFPVKPPIRRKPVNISTIVSPEPSTIVSHEPSTIVSHEPSTIVSPEPSTIVSHEPSTIVSPEPSTIVSPEPSTIISHEPSTIVSPDLSTTVTPEPSTIITLEANNAP